MPSSLQVDKRSWFPRLLRNRSKVDAAKSKIKFKNALLLLASVEFPNTELTVDCCVHIKHSLDSFRGIPLLPLFAIFTLRLRT